MEKKIFNEVSVKPETVSYIIGKNGCHIKDITSRIKNGAYIEYKSEGSKFILSSYSKESLTKLVNEIKFLENEFEINRKKYAEYRFKNRIVDHALVTEIIQSLKQFTNSAFAEYKGDNLFILSNYKTEGLQDMITQVQTYDKPIQESPNSQQSSIWTLRRDWSKVLNEIDKLENNENDACSSTNKKTKLIDNNCKQFMITDDMNIVEAIDNYIDDSDTEFNEINLNDEDMEFIKMSEDEFIKNHRNNKFYHI
jgi:hydroxymethylpyrimidine pyrophosphatase-like HAD family hydrolase